MTIDIETGEHLGGKFAKMYFKDMQLLLGLSGTDIRVLMLMVKAIGLGHKTEIQMTPKRKKEYASQLGLKSHLQITNALKKLSLSGVVKKTNPNDRFDPRFMVNPEIFFAGSDYQFATVIIQYSSGVREVKSFSNDDAANKYLEDKKQENTNVDSK